MSVHMNISRHDRVAMLVVRGPLTSEDVTRCLLDLAGDPVSGRLGRLLDIMMPHKAFDDSQVDHICDLIRGCRSVELGTRVGIVSDNVDLIRGVSEGCVGVTFKFFDSLHDARRWLGSRA
jgi:hypothetical protein